MLYQLTSDLIILVLAVLDTGNVDGSLIRKDLSARSKISITSIENSVQHALVKKEITHPLGHDNVNLRKREVHLFHLSLQKSDLISHTVHGNDLTSLFNDGRHVDTNNVFCAGTDGEPNKPNG